MPLTGTGVGVIVAVGVAVGWRVAVGVAVKMAVGGGAVGVAGREARGPQAVIPVRRRALPTRRKAVRGRSIIVEGW
jgi:hypothetical protein